MKLEQKYQNERVIENQESSATECKVIWSFDKISWLAPIYLVALVGGAMTFSIENLVVFLITTATTLCFGHSLGMHRLLIHRSYAAPKWLEYFLVHCGVVVGLAGPKGMMLTHDFRDWAQRQKECHDYFAHRQPMLIDGVWQLFCDLKLSSPPQYQIEECVENDQVYQWMEKTWKLQQLPLALLLFVFGGIEWVIWGSAVRIAVSVTGHWLIGYFAHNDGDRHWHVEGAAVQGFNIRFASLLTMGESYHNNHHAYPGSALLGIKPGEIDPGWWVLKVLEALGLVWDIKSPNDLPNRGELINLESDPVAEK